MRALLVTLLVLALFVTLMNIYVRTFVPIDQQSCAFASEQDYDLCQSSH